MASLGSRISYLRNKRGISQEEFSKILKIGKSTLGMYEIDKREPSHEMSARIANYFNVSLDWLLTGNEKDTEYNLPEEVILKVMREAEVEYNVSLRDDPLVESAVRDLLHNLAKMKKEFQKND